MKNAVHSRTLYVQLELFSQHSNLQMYDFKEKKNIPIDDPIPSMSREQLGTVALALFFSFAYIGLIRILGYFVTTFIFIAGFSYWQNKNQKKSWYILVPVIMIVIVFLAFKLMLNVPLPSGLLI